MVNKVWAFFIIIGICFCFITGRVDIINNEILLSAKTGFDMTIKILPVMALWLGIMKIASVSGLIEKFSRLISPFLSKIFPEIPAGHESLSLIATNMTANLF